MPALTRGEISYLRESLFPEPPPLDINVQLYWSVPQTEQYLRGYKRRDYGRNGAPRIDRYQYGIEFHSHEEKWGTCKKFYNYWLFHDAQRSFTLTYGGLPIGTIGFSLARPIARRYALTVNQIQGVKYKRTPSVEIPSRSISWPQALLNLVVVFAPAAGAKEVRVISHRKNKSTAVKNNKNGNAHRLYEGTAENCGFEYYEKRALWIKKLDI